MGQGTIFAVHFQIVVLLVSLERILRVRAKLAVRAVFSHVVVQLDEVCLELFDILPDVAFTQNAFAQFGGMNFSGPGFDVGIVRPAIAVNVSAGELVGFLLHAAAVGDQAGRAGSVALNGVNIVAAHLIDKAHMANAFLGAGIEIDHVAHLGFALAALDIAALLLKPVCAGGGVVVQAAAQQGNGRLQAKGHDETPGNKRRAPFHRLRAAAAPGVIVTIVFGVVVLARVRGLAVQLAVGRLLQIAEFVRCNLDDTVGIAFRHCSFLL